MPWWPATSEVNSNPTLRAPASAFVRVGQPSVLRGENDWVGGGHAATFGTRVEAEALPRVDDAGCDGGVVGGVAGGGGLGDRAALLDGELHRDLALQARIATKLL